MMWTTMVTSCAVLAMLWTTSYAHVALTYPPARILDLDFLANTRTVAPCGMPKGTVKTSILAGSSFNVTWHVPYPHRGGYKLQILDTAERPLLALTPGGFVSSDVTALSFLVHLPVNFTCADCTIQLIRQANEFGSNYFFWSCADIDIVPRKDYQEDCSGHGDVDKGVCKCHRLYHGARCQYREDCLDDSDCGERGLCVDVEATSSPRWQCYNSLGWFGSKFNTAIGVNLSQFKSRQLSPTFLLYWRIFKETDEIEMALVVNGTSFAAIGWRPKSITSACKNFPYIAETAAGINSVKSESTEDLSSELDPFTTESPDKPTVAATTSKSTTSKTTTEVHATTAGKPKPTTSSSVATSTSKPAKRERREASKYKTTEEVPAHPYSQSQDFSGMDCTDIVIGTARGNSTRVLDYYTRDRSTPRVDSYWGGKNDLTAALGFEKDGITTIVFRKKLKATELSDHSIVPGPMHVIWSQGQELGRYSHFVPSGLEAEHASIPDYYRPDELKYHGAGPNQRGKTLIDFFE